MRVLYMQMIEDGFPRRSHFNLPCSNRKGPCLNFLFGAFRTYGFQTAIAKCRIYAVGRFAATSRKLLGGHFLAISKRHLDLWATSGGTLRNMKRGKAPTREFMGETSGNIGGSISSRVQDETWKPICAGPSERNDPLS